MSEKKGFFKRLAQGLSKTRDNIASSFDSIFSGFSGIDEDFYEELEEILIMSDMGIDTTMNIIEDLKKKVKENKIKEPEECRQLLIDSIKDQMRLDDSAYDFIDKKSVVLVIGVNGVGKTTSVGKLAASLKGQGKKVLLAAADTFRAGAIEQLKEWSNRAGVDIISQAEGADPAAVVSGRRAVCDRLRSAFACRRSGHVLRCDAAAAAASGDDAPAPAGRAAEFQRQAPAIRLSGIFHHESGVQRHDGHDRPSDQRRL